MELCNTKTISNLTSHRSFVYTNTSRIHSKTFLPLKKINASQRNPGLRHLSTSLLRAINSEETSTSTEEDVEVFAEKTTVKETPTFLQNTVQEEASKEEMPKDEASLTEQMMSFDFMDGLNLKLDSEDAYSYLVYGSGALITLWLASAVVGAIDSIPVFPKVLEIVGLGYTIWFSSRYLIFKKNREELFTKIGELKKQVLGSTDE
ncbi:hypothetical protein MKW94_030431 [Papaver nudicaule]|uniref:Cyanobacterial aminoacyl-tRNA synthetase CAAD domain-containing protein n=1 Tax=Papaver nudicaule TaxID=74823 RepID=A0AA41V0B1_PAPNU|nr:hypothetical protein [Papaver nudicaule]